MCAAENTAPIGFLTAVELPETGFCGGLLLLNERGRPLEFHCNSPIRPSRAQEILYGSTLRTFLLSEAIAQSLIEKCSRPPAAILTDLAELWELNRWNTMPVVWVPPDSASEGTETSPRSRGQWIPGDIGGQQIGISACGQDQWAELDAAIGNFAKRLPLAEPFQRIQLAIAEAQSSARWRESA